MRVSAAARDLTRLERSLAEQDARLPDDGTVRLAFGSGEIAAQRRCRRPGRRTAPLHVLIGQVLASSIEWPLAKRSIDSLQPAAPAGER